MTEEREAEIRLWTRQGWSDDGIATELLAALDAERELRQQAERELSEQEGYPGIAHDFLTCRRQRDEAEGRAEKLAQVVQDEHEQQCGCSEPGRSGICVASIPVRYALAEYRAAKTSGDTA